MFYNCKVFNQNITNWNTRNVKNMSYMFKNAHEFNQEIQSWCVDNVDYFRNIKFTNIFIKRSRIIKHICSYF